MLKGEVMATNEWYDSRPQDLSTVRLCIQTAIEVNHFIEHKEQK